MAELSTLGNVIKAAYEDEPNTNAYTDPEKAKLAGLSELATSGAWEDLEKPAFIAAGANAAEARDAIGAMDVALAGVAGGVAQLDGAGTVPLSQLNLEGLAYKGLWDAANNTPAIADGVGEDADFYFASSDGTVDLGSGSIEFSEGDIVIYFDGVWSRLGSTQIVQSVNGMIGNVQVTSSSIGALPDTYQPAWDDIQNKPAMPALPRGSIGPAIPALRVPLVDVQSIPSGSRAKITQWGGGYDQFDMRSGGDFAIPSWAAYARVTCSVVSWDLSAANYLHLQISRNGGVVATGAMRGMDTAQFPVAYADTGIMGVSGGDVFSLHVMHNYGSSRNITNTGGPMVNIELFAAL